jgi:hypothetical protein
MDNLDHESFSLLDKKTIPLLLTIYIKAYQVCLSCLNFIYIPCVCCFVHLFVPFSLYYYGLSKSGN